MYNNLTLGGENISYCKLSDYITNNILGSNFIIDGTDCYEGEFHLGDNVEHYVSTGGSIDPFHGDLRSINLYTRSQVDTENYDELILDAITSIDKFGSLKELNVPIRLESLLSRRSKEITSLILFSGKVPTLAEHQNLLALLKINYPELTHLLISTVSKVDLNYDLKYYGTHLSEIQEKVCKINLIKL